MSLVDDIEAGERHRKWIEWYGPGSERKDAPPAPAYKDCDACPLRQDAEDETDRRQLCRACPWDHLPDGPSLRFRVASELAALPTEVLALEASELTHMEAVDLETLRTYRRSKMIGGIFG